MKHNKIFRFLSYGLVGCGLATVFTSCRFEEDDFFDESAALRVEHANEQVQQILTAPENGWVMQYFCGSDVAHFEGFNLFARFTDGYRVTLAGNHRMLRDGNAGKYTEATSLYDLLLEDGPVLAFNTWNDVLTPFVDPVSPWVAPDYLSKDGEGMGGDHNLVIMSYNENEVLLRGERHQGRVRLVKCDRTWQEYIAASEAMRDSISSTEFPNYYVTSDADTLFFMAERKGYEGLRSGRIQYSDDLDNPIKFDSLSCVFTPTGLRFELPDTIAGHSFQELTLANDGTALINEDGSVRVFAVWDRPIATRTDIWWIDLETLSGELKTLADEINATLTAANRNYSLSRIGIGKTTNANNVTGLCVEWYTNTRKTSRGMGGLALRRSTPGYGQLAIECDENANIDNNMNARAATVVSAVRAFGAALAGTYDIVPESYLTPAPAVFTSTDGSTSFRLTH